MAHTLAKWRSGAYATLTVGQDQTFDIGIVRASENCGYMGAEQAPLIRVANDTAAVHNYLCAVASNTGKIWIKTAANVAEGACLTVATGIHVPDIYEFDVGVRATGSVTLVNNPSDGQTVTISDGSTVKIFEFDDGVIGSDGELTIAAGNVADGNTVTAWGHTYEFDGGVHATGTIEFIAQPADGQTLTLDDGTNAPTVFEFDDDASVGAGNVAVTIGASFIATATALHVAINAEGATLTVTSADDTAGTLTITNDAVGDAAAQNTPIVTTSHAVILSGMLGGAEPGAGPVGAGNTAVAIGADANASATNLLAAITTDTPELLAGSSVTGGSGETLFVWDVEDSAYNTTLVKVGANITIDHQPTDGRTPGTAITAGNVGVVIAATNALTAVNLRTQIGAAAFNILCDPITVPGTVPLYNINYGVAGNVAISDTGGADITFTGMGIAPATPGVDPGGAVQAGHKAVARGATPAASLANLATALTTNVATSHIVPGTIYTDTIDGVAVTVLPYSGAANTDRIAVCWSTDADDIVTPANGWPVANVSCKIGTTEYEENGIGLVEVDEVVTGFPTETHLSQTDVVSSTGGAATYAYLYIDKTDRGNVVAGPITANILFVPILDTATFAHSAFAAGGDLIVATGIVKSGR